MANRTYHPRGETVDGYPVGDHPLYVTWANMMGRCTNPADIGYENYGGRGITVCDRWHHFKNFAADMGFKPEQSMSIERLDNNVGYSPSNCVWATRSDQCVNRRKFKNNTSGETGVVKTDGSWIARFTYEGVRHNIGWFASKDEAILARTNFVDIFFVDRPAALLLLPKDKARHTSSTKIRGVTPHVDGGFTVRVTVSGVRHYLGYFKTLDEAANAKQDFIAKQTS